MLKAWPDQNLDVVAEGQHPITGEQLVRHQTARKTTNARGERVTTMEHRAGWPRANLRSSPASTSRLLRVVAGFQVSINGRFWVSTEGSDRQAETANEGIPAPG